MQQNYPELHAHDNNYLQPRARRSPLARLPPMTAHRSHHGHQCYAHAPIATRGGRSGPDGPLGACMIYWGSAEALRRQQSRECARHRLVGHRGAFSESLYENIEPCSKSLRRHTSSIVRRRWGAGPHGGVCARGGAAVTCAVFESWQAGTTLFELRLPPFCCWGPG